MSFITIKFLFFLMVLISIYFFDTAQMAMDGSACRKFLFLYFSRHKGRSFYFVYLSVCMVYSAPS